MGTIGAAARLTEVKKEVSFIGKYMSMTGLYALSHFVVDFSCAFFIFSELSGSLQWPLCLLLYNIFAFAMQMPLGLLAEKMRMTRTLAALGCIIIAASPFITVFPLLFCSFAGLGNALFHIGAGRDVLIGRKSTYSALGLFVSPGAAGIFLGTLAGKTAEVPTIVVSGILIVLSTVIFFFIPVLWDEKRMVIPVRTGPIHGKGEADKLLILMLLSLFLVVCLRSYVGMTLSFPWKSTGNKVLYLVIAVVCGKAVGGILADRFGPLKTSFASFFLCSILFLFYRQPFCGVLAVFLFNMTMPITLGGVSNVLKSNPGFAFGLLTFGLFIGVIPVFLGAENALSIPYGFTAACITSAVLMFYGFKGPVHAD